jgi:hypothetical protein
MHTSEAVYRPAGPFLAVTIKLVPDSTRYAMSAPLSVLFSVSEGFNEFDPSGHRKVLSFIEFQTERMESLNSLSVPLRYSSEDFGAIVEVHLERTMLEPPPYSSGQKFPRQPCFLNSIFDTGSQWIKVNQFGSGNNHFCAWMLNGERPAAENDRLGFTYSTGALVEGLCGRVPPPRVLKIPGPEEFLFVGSGLVFPQELCQVYAGRVLDKRN